MFPAYAERLYWLTNFRGSAGVAIVTLKTAAIFVDGAIRSRCASRWTRRSSRRSI